MKRGIAALLAALMLLCGCTDYESETERTVYTPTSSTEILSGVEETAPVESPEHFALSYYPKEGFNPFTCGNLTNRTVLSLLYESLFLVNGDFSVEPVLCDSFTVSEDQQVYTLKLVDGVTFSDGSALTAGDVVASLNEARESRYYISRLEHVAYVSAEDEKTVRIELDLPYENLPLVLDIPVLKKGTLESTTPVGTGPYEVLPLGGGSFYLGRSSAKSAAPNPVVDISMITLVPADSSNEVRDSFEFGQTSLVCTDPNSTSSAGYHCNYEVWDCPTTIMQYIGFNRNRGKLSSRALRSTVTHVIDRTAIAVDIMDGYATPAMLPCSPLSPFYDSNLAKEYDMNVPVFRNALAAAGGGNSKSNPEIMLVCGDSTSRVAAAQSVADTLAQYGLYVKVSILDHDSFVDALNEGAYDLYYGEVKLNACFDLSSFFEEDANLYFTGMADEELVELSHASLQNSGNYRELFDTIMKNGMLCPVLFKTYAVYMSRGAINRLSPAVDCVMHISNGRTLTDAAPAPVKPEPEANGSEDMPNADEGSTEETSSDEGDADSDEDESDPEGDPSEEDE